MKRVRVLVKNGGKKYMCRWGITGTLACLLQKKVHLETLVETYGMRTHYSSLCTKHVSVSEVPTVSKLPGQSRIWPVCPMSHPEMNIFLDCPGNPRMLRQILVLKAQRRPDFELLQMCLNIKLRRFLSLMYVRTN